MMNRRQMLMRLNSLVEATATGNPVTFNTDVAKPLLQTLIGMEPVQAGNGDPSPQNVRPLTGWQGVTVTRAGKNMFSYDLTIRDGYWQNNGGIYAFTGTNNIVQKTSANGWQYIRIPVQAGDKITLSGFIDQGGTYSAFLQSEDPASAFNGFGTHLTNGTKTVPAGAKYLGLVIYKIATNYSIYPNAQLELGSTATAYAPYSGESVEVTFPAMGKNLFGGLPMGRKIANTVRDAVLDTTNKTVTFANGKLVTDNGLWFDDFDPTKRYTLILTLSNTQENHAATNMRIRYTDNSLVNMQKSGTSKQTIVYQTVSGKSVAAFEYASQTGTTVLYYEESGIFEGLLTAADFEPYTNTVYGGTVDLAAGTLTVTHGIVDLGNLDWELSNKNSSVANGIRIKAILDEAEGAAPNVVADAACSSYKMCTGSQTFSGTVGLAVGNKAAEGGHARVQIFDNRFDDVDTFAATLDGVQLVFAFAEPLTYQLTPAQVNALLGDNTLWSDTNGTNTITYLKKK